MPTPQPARFAWLLLVVVALCTAGCDLATKHWAHDHLSSARAESVPVCAPGSTTYQRVPQPPHQVVGDVFELRYAENCGAAWSMMRDLPRGIRLSIFTAVGLAALAMIVHSVRTAGRGAMWTALGGGLILGGAMGNLIDRWHAGYVTDFLHVHGGGSWDYPVFNVADVVIFLGFVAFFLGRWRTEPKPAT